MLVENGESAKAAVAAYIDLNPVRAKIVADPKDYRWNGYGEACAGGKQAREGLVAVHESRWLERPDGWRHAAKRYRVLLYTAGEERHAAYGGRVVRPGIATAEVEKVNASLQRQLQALRGGGILVFAFSNHNFRLSFFFFAKAYAKIHLLII